MRFDNVILEKIGEVVKGTSKAGNDFAVLSAVITINVGGTHRDSLCVKVFREDCIRALQHMQVGAVMSSVQVDLSVREYNGRDYQDAILWSVN